MKKNEVKRLKKLRLSRETLHILVSSDVQRAKGGSIGISCQTAAVCPGGGANCPVDLGDERT
jgi:hypothetical protein